MPLRCCLLKTCGTGHGGLAIKGDHEIGSPIGQRAGSPQGEVQRRQVRNLKQARRQSATWFGDRNVELQRLCRRLELRLRRQPGLDAIDPVHIKVCRHQGGIKRDRSGAGSRQGHGSPEQGVSEIDFRERQPFQRHVERQ